jgi:hypothetical protein
VIHDVFQLFEVDDETRLRIDLPFTVTSSVVVAVAVRVIALAEGGAVLFRCEVGIV